MSLLKRATFFLLFFCYLQNVQIISYLKMGLRLFKTTLLFYPKNAGATFFSVQGLHLFWSLEYVGTILCTYLPQSRHF